MREEQGYSLTELLIVLAIVIIITTVAVARAPFLIVSVDVENVAAQVAGSIGRARRAALAGNRAIPARTFDINNAVAGRHPGITITTLQPTANNSCQGTCAAQSICISGIKLCYGGNGQFTFDRLTGRLTTSQIVFVTGTNRKLAVIVSGEGKTDIAELIADQWKLSSALRKLLPTNSNN